MARKLSNSYGINELKSLGEDDLFGILERPSSLRLDDTNFRLLIRECLMRIFASSKTLYFLIDDHLLNHEEDCWNYCMKGELEKDELGYE